MRIGDRVKLIVAYEKWDGTPAVLGEDTGTIIGIGTEEDRDGETAMTAVLVVWDKDRSLVTYDNEERDPDEGPTNNIGELEVVTPLLYANVYMHDRAYGGPEEGGWWYSVYSPEDEHCVKCDSEENAEMAAECIEEWCKAENADRRPPHSVISEGHYVVRLEAWPAEGSPAQRPYYC